MSKEISQEQRDTLQKIENNNIRDYALINTIEEIYNTLNIHELQVVQSVIGAISHHLFTKHFDEQIEINVKALVKTFEDINELAIETLINKPSINPILQNNPK